MTRTLIAVVAVIGLTSFALLYIYPRGYQDERPPSGTRVAEGNSSQTAIAESYSASTIAVGTTESRRSEVANHSTSTSEVSTGAQPYSTTSSCGPSCQTTPVTIAAFDVHGNPIAATLMLDGQVIGTGLGTARIAAGEHTLECGQVNGYTTPPRLKFFTKGYDIPLPLTCTYYEPAIASTNVELTVTVQYCDEFVPQRCGPDADELVILTGRVNGSATTDANGHVAFSVPVSDVPYKATIDYGIDYLAQSVTIRASNSGGNGTITIWWRVP